MPGETSQTVPLLSSLIRRSASKLNMDEKMDQQKWPKDSKAESRKGDDFAHLLASVSLIIFVIFSAAIVVFNDPKGLSFFAFHPPLQSLAMALFTWGILTLQPTSQPTSKAAGLFRHQILMLCIGLPLFIAGSWTVIYNKNINKKPHFASWHGTLGIITMAWTVLQIFIGGGSVWFRGKYFGGGMKAKSVWKYHRLSGYVLYFLFIVTAHLGGGWSTFAVKNSTYTYRFLSCTIAPVVALIAVYNRTRLTKMRFY